MGILEGQVALVTGAGRGFGRAIAERFAVEGATVALLARSLSQLDEVAQSIRDAGGQAIGVRCDVADAGSIESATRKAEELLGPTDLLVNNAGVLHSGERFGRLGLANLEDSFRTNAAGPLLLVQALAPLLAGGARVANLSSELGSIGATSRFGTPSYNMSKAAQNMATALLAHALRERGIVVVALHPGWVRTDMGGEGASLAPAESAAGLLRAIAGLAPDDSGRFLDWRGRPLPW